MAIICALQFNDYSGAMVTDEEYWLLRRRKTYFGDAIHSLVPAEPADRLGVEALYAGWGYPQVHHELVNKTVKAVAAKLGANGGPKPVTVEQVGQVLLDQYHGIVRRRVDDILRFFYGFNTDDFTRGWFEENGSRYDITQDKVKSIAHNLIACKNKDRWNKPIFENRGVIMGFDSKHGLQMFHLNGEKHVLAYVSGGFEAVGKGQYVSGASFADFFLQKPVHKRRTGYDRVEGMVQTLHAAILAGRFFQEVGGTFSIVYLDGREKEQAKRIKRIPDDRCRLAHEIVLSWYKREIQKEAAYGLVERLIYQDEDFDTVEDDLFAAAQDRSRMEKLLRGYKVDYTDPERPATKPAARSGKGGRK